MISAAGFIF